MNQKQPRNVPLNEKMACENCGAELKYLPGSPSISCEYCGYTQKILKNNENVKFLELELKPYLEKMGSQSHSQEIAMIECRNCGANQHIEERYKSLKCVYCAAPLIIDDAKTEQWILPGAILPFQLDNKKTHQIFSKWVKGLWLAPNKLKKASLDIQYTKGLYLPYWTFDARLYADYEGHRGDYYYVTVPYTYTRDGKTVTEQRRERRIRWQYVTGNIKGFIDDTLIKASSQPENTIPPSISHWNLDALVTFRNEYLAGFVTQKYTIPLKDAHLSSVHEAKRIASVWAKRDIGGDRQQISDIKVNLTEQTFKHILLPVYISSYKYKGKVYHFYVNGQTGAIAGERPYSKWKVIAAVFLAILLMITAYFLMQ
ncbi:LSD1 subclass zinc finger protein [Balneicella halophila]|uniref:LSD1 subclass zinc finger protein n=1 Tax=Balneicella halophila TaxID=1537566 RepID=A0A7L4UQK6_BALHA|nr:DNA helicase PriA [Balneicella halophila]PVX52033.1 LSD1 subclass zinc finger protein [Balneicella halophila]